MGPSIHQVEVVMGTKRYLLRGQDPEILKALAARVDATLGDIAGPGGNRDDFKVGVLAALNIAADDDDRRASWLAGARSLAHEARETEVLLSRLHETLRP